MTFSRLQNEVWKKIMIKSHFRGQETWQWRVSPMAENRSFIPAMPMSAKNPISMISPTFLSYVILPQRSFKRKPGYESPPPRTTRRRGGILVSEELRVVLLAGEVKNKASYIYQEAKFASGPLKSRFLVVAEKLTAPTWAQCCFGMDIGKQKKRRRSNWGKARNMTLVV